MRIAIMGDLHYPSRYGVEKELEEDVIKTRDTFFANFIESFFSEEADLYVSLGDLTNFGTKDELEEIYSIIRRYDKPFKHVLGNHDLYSMSRMQVLEITNMEGDHIVEKDEAIFVFLETAREMNLTEYDGWVTEEQIKWLEQIIEESGEKTIVLFAHHPVYDTTAHSNYKMASVHPSIELWEVLRKKRGNGFYINGHTHTDSIVYKDNWGFIQVAAVLDDPSVRMLTITKDECSVTAVPLSTSESIKQAAIIGEKLEHFTPNTRAIGTTLNRNKVFSLTDYHSYQV